MQRILEADGLSCWAAWVFDTRERASDFRVVYGWSPFGGW
jgi:hypothetical protein